MGYCADCGCRTSNGTCSNCQEELYIVENQWEYMDKPVSQEFMDKAISQINQTPNVRGKGKYERND